MPRNRELLPAHPSELTERDRAYYEAWRRLAAYYGRPPSLRELAGYVRRSASSVQEVLERLAACRVLRRDASGRYVAR